MRIFFFSSLLLLIITGVSCQDENAEDVFEGAPFSDDSDRDVAMGDTMEMNEGSDTFEISTAMLEDFTEPTPTNNTQAELSMSLNNSTELIDEVNPVDPFETSASSTMETAEKVHGSLGNSSESMDTVVALMNKIPQASVAVSNQSITDQMLVEHRVLKEKEEVPEPKKKEELVTKATEAPKEEENVKEASSDITSIMGSSENNTEAILSLDAENEGELPFDQDKLSSVFEQDGSPVDLLGLTDSSSPSSAPSDPEFPILQMPEESAEIIGQEPREKPHMELTTKATQKAGIPTEPIELKAAEPVATSTLETPKVAVIVEPKEEMIEHPMEHKHEPETTPEPTPEPTIVTQEPVPEPKAEPEPEPKAEPEPKPEPEPTPEPTPEPVPELKPEPQPEPQAKMETEKKEEAKVAEERPHIAAGRPISGMKSDFKMRITSIEFMKELEDKSSAKWRKLRDQIQPQISDIVGNILGEDFISFTVDSFTNGSVIVNGFIETKKPIQDAQNTANRIETILSSMNNQIGEHMIDASSITVDGFSTSSYRNPADVPMASSTLLIGSVIAIAVLLLVIGAFIAITMSNKRKNGSMKMRFDDLSSSMESGRQGYANGTEIMPVASHHAAPMTNSHKPVYREEREIS